MKTTICRRLFVLIILLLLFTNLAPCWAEKTVPDTIIATVSASNMSDCEATTEGSSLAQLTSSATPVAQQPDRRNFRITAIDPSRGLVTAQSVGTGEIIHFTILPAALPNLRPGQMVDVNFISMNGAHGNCACGQKSDGSCWCTTDTACCGPLHGCPMASCDKDRTGQGSGLKPNVLTPHGQNPNP